MKIYCIGIGGIGLSALARYYKHKGYDVLGSDAASSDLISSLRGEGIQVSIGSYVADITKEIDLLVYTIAIAPDNQELARAKELGIRCLSYPEALGEVTKEYTTIAVCGTHGKTTTTALTYYALKACGINPTVIIGSLLTDGGTNFVAGDSKYLVVEACEYKRSFLNLNPAHIIVTNIDADHLDYYKDIEDIHDAFQNFANKLGADGLLVTHSNVSLDTKGKKVDADCIDKKSFELSVLGDHNKSNAQLVLALTDALRLDQEKAKYGLKAFPGTWRRMEYKGRTSHGVQVYDDYGHHPAEIQATYSALREKYVKGEYKIVMLFQPHLYSRTKVLLQEFVEVLKEVDEVDILPIYKARLEDTSIISEQIVADEINKAGGNAKVVLSLSDIPQLIESMEREKTVIINMGAGNAFEEVNKVSFI